MIKSSREAVTMARAMGLVDIELVEKRHHLLFTAREPNTNKVVKLALGRGQHHASNPRAHVQMLTSLRRQLRS